MTTLAGRRILVVEDEMFVAMLIEDVLTEHGCEMVGPARRVAEALRLIEANDIEAAILDVNLAGEASYPIADELKRRGVPFVFATGYGSAGVSADYNGHETLQKPFQERELAQVLARTLARGKNS